MSKLDKKLIEQRIKEGVSLAIKTDECFKNKNVNSLAGYVAIRLMYIGMVDYLGKNFAKKINKIIDMRATAQCEMTLDEKIKKGAI